MDHRLYGAVISGDQNLFEELTRSNANILIQVSSQQQDTILHVAAKFKRNEIAKIIMNLQPSLAYKQNSKGDTPLHISARLGNLDMNKIIINYESLGSVEVEANERVMRMENNMKNTALHEAARKGYSEVVEFLMQKDAELVMLTNNAGESPSFLAADKMHFKIADHILKVVPACSVRGRNKMNALHAAIIRSFISDEHMQLEKGKLMQYALLPIVHLSIRDLVRSFRMLRAVNRYTSENAQNSVNITDFIVQLVKKCPSAILEADNFGWTPLHYAAHVGNLGIVKELLLANDSTAYIKTKEGVTSLHIAARKGRVQVLQKIVETTPDIWDLEDNQGRTALRIAVESGKSQAVKFILEKVSEDLINHQDNEGNTALYVAALQGYAKIFQLLMSDGRADKTTMNNQGLAVMDIIYSNMEIKLMRKIWMIMLPRIVDGQASLELVLNRTNTEAQSTESKELEKLQEIGRKEPVEEGIETHGVEQLGAVKKEEPQGEETLSYNHLRNISSTNILVATIIATISFAAAFTVPGGIESNGPDKGSPVLGKKFFFKVFVLYNTLAFCFSTASMILHNSNSVLVNRKALAIRTYFAISFTNWAIGNIVAAFTTGSYAMLADSAPLLAKGVLCIGCLFYTLSYLAHFQ